MSAPRQPGLLRAVWTYTSFDLVNQPAHRYLMMLALPLFMFGSILLITGISDRSAPKKNVAVAIVAPTEALHVELADWFREDLHVRVVRELPADRSELGLIADLPEAWALHGEVEITRSEGVSQGREDKLRRRLLQWLAVHWTTEAGGPLPVLRIEDSAGRPLPEQPLPKPDGIQQVTDDLEPQMVLHGLGWMVLGLGVLIGFGVGSAISKSSSAGFNRVLTVGTPKRAVYLSEVVTGTLLASAKALAWLAGLAIIVGLSGLMSSDVGLPDLRTLASSTPFLLCLAAFVMVQSCGVGCFMDRLAEELPRETRSRVGQVLVLIPMLGLFALDLENLDATIATFLSPMPVVGPVALWSHSVEGGTYVLLGLGIQGVYTWLALELGSWAFLLDEPPLTVLKRRLARRRADPSGR